MRLSEKVQNMQELPKRIAKSNFLRTQVLRFSTATKIIIGSTGLDGPIKTEMTPLALFSSSTTRRKNRNPESVQFDPHSSIVRTIQVKFRWPKYILTTGKAGYRLRSKTSCRVIQGTFQQNNQNFIWRNQKCSCQLLKSFDNSRFVEPWMPLLLSN